jgi:hypothetical protein
LAAHGVTPHHRRSFIPVRQLTLDFASASGEPAAPLDAQALAALAAQLEQQVSDDDASMMGD